MHYLIDMGDGETYAVCNSGTVRWISDRPLRFSVVAYAGFNDEDVIVYANGKTLAPDADGYYTLQKSDETAVITAAGAVKDDSVPGGKLSFRELPLRFFRKIVGFRAEIERNSFR